MKTTLEGQSTKIQQLEKENCTLYENVKQLTRRVNLLKHNTQYNPYQKIGPKIWLVP